MIAFLVNWYAEQCDGEWEHRYGIEIGTLDNPGWSLKVDLVETPLQGRAFDRRKIERSDDDWIHLWSDGNHFQSACGPRNLAEALDEFAAFASDE